jgi:hypothetical protein
MVPGVRQRRDGKFALATAQQQLPTQWLQQARPKAAGGGPPEGKQGRLIAPAGVGVDLGDAS